MSADLIAKLERATGRDPELNRAIDEFDVRSRGKLAPDKPFCVEVSPDFTGSLTDTLTLIRDGENVTLKRGFKGPYSSALITKNGERAFVAEQCLAFHERPDNELALCLATAVMKLRAAATVAA